ncbi:hypothetical protein HPB47_006374, partial [Ixodes persulcatus]
MMPDGRTTTEFSIVLGPLDVFYGQWEWACEECRRRRPLAPLADDVFAEQSETIMGLPKLDVWFAEADDELPPFSFVVSLGFLNSLGGVLTIAEILTGVITFALAYCSRIYVYQLSRLVVRAEPDPSVVYVIIVSFLYWFVSLLVLTSALLSSTGLLVTSTFF